MEGAVELQTVPKTEGTREPTQTISLHFEMVRLRYKEGSLGQVHTVRKELSRDWTQLISHGVLSTELRTHTASCPCPDLLCAWDLNTVIKILTYK